MAGNKDDGKPPKSSRHFPPTFSASFGRGHFQGFPHFTQNDGDVEHVQQGLFCLEKTQGIQQTIFPFSQWIFCVSFFQYFYHK